MIKHTGGCHCGRVTFEVIAPVVLKVSECNCSICSKAGVESAGRQNRRDGLNSE
jgi:hypothetical protein